MVPLLPRGQSCTFRWVRGRRAVVASGSATTCAEGFSLGYWVSAETDNAGVVASKAV